MCQLYNRSLSPASSAVPLFLVCLRTLILEILSLLLFLVSLLTDSDLLDRTEQISADTDDDDHTHTDRLSAGVCAGRLARSVGLCLTRLLFPF